MEEGHSRGLELTSEGFAEGFACPGAAQDFGLSKIVEEGHSRGLELTSQGFLLRVLLALARCRTLG